VIIIALGALRKMLFEWGESAPIWGRYGGLKISLLAIFGPKFLEIHCSESPHFLLVGRHFRPLGILKIGRKSQLTILRKVRSKLASIEFFPKLQFLGAIISEP